MHVLNTVSWDITNGNYLLLTELLKISLQPPSYWQTTLKCHQQLRFVCLLPKLLPFYKKRQSHKNPKQDNFLSCPSLAFLSLFLFLFSFLLFLFSWCGFVLFWCYLKRVQIHLFLTTTLLWSTYIFLPIYWACMSKSHLTKITLVLLTGSGPKGQFYFLSHKWESVSLTK